MGAILLIVGLFLILVHWGVIVYLRWSGISLKEEIQNLREALARAPKPDGISVLLGNQAVNDVSVNYGERCVLCAKRNNVAHTIITSSGREIPGIVSPILDHLHQNGVLIRGTPLRVVSVGGTMAVVVGGM